MGCSAWALLAERSGNSKEHKMYPQAVLFRILKVMMEWMSITYMKSYSPFSLSYSPKKHVETSYFAISKSNLIIQGLSHWINQSCLKPRRLFAQLKATCSWFWCLSVTCCKHNFAKVSNCKPWRHGCPRLHAVIVRLHHCSHSGLAGPPWINVLCRQHLYILREQIYKAVTYSILFSMYEYIIKERKSNSGAV